ncbi:hypothetical protein AMK59_2207 [Oryctes borbonicus]|uniref:Uncharacterized protein n=1 Tax=Oryctes borbonicus TaxID=1629725 RepID=A0A0T6BBM8_9SCAR|nr:hypothetical protein AMK59_2207 [Oryctes borbonicus]
MPREGYRTVGALSGDIKTPPAASPVRKERLSKSKEELKKEASEVLDRADKLDCVVQNSPSYPEKYYTLPVRKKNRGEYPQASLERRTRRRNSDDLSVIPPKKPPRTFASTTTTSRQRPSIFNLFRRTETAPTPKKSNLRRTASDATNTKSKSQLNDVPTSRSRPSESNETKESQASLRKGKKKQLSPIIEATPREDYFDIKNNKQKANHENDRENNKEHKPSITEQLKEYIDEVDTALFHETGVRVTPPGCESKPPEVVIIDVDKADQISSNKKGKSKSFSQKLKSLTKKQEDKKDKTGKKEKGKKVERSISVNVDKKRKKPEITRRHSLEDLSKKEASASPHIKETIKTLNSPSDRKGKMLHSSQKPIDKLPLTKGRTVDTMVKRLNHGSSSPPPPRTNMMVTPNVSVQHNNNQPFSYTRGHSPEKTDPPKPIIYAQVVCNNGGNPNKQTIHTTYINGKKNMPHSDSDEGLGTEENTGFNRKYEEKRTVTKFGDERYEPPSRRTSDIYNDMEEEYPITPNVKNVNYNGFGRYDKFTENYGFKTEQNYFVDSSSRGRADGMDSKRRESLTEQENNLNHSKYDNFNSSNNRNDVSLRRDQLESRITRRFGEKSYRMSPEYSPKPANIYITETTSRYYRSGSNSPVGYKEKYVSETRVDSKGEKRTAESRSRKYFGDGDEYNSFENEPKSLDSQISDYRSSPEQNRHFESSHRVSHHQDKYVSKKSKQQMFKNKDYYKSNPEIHVKNYDSYKYNDRLGYQESYHDSLKREKRENRLNSDKYRNDRYFDNTDSERKDKFGDSGIENDFRRDSGDNFKMSRSSAEKQKHQQRETSNESEDEGFASSLLIASERQHTEDNFTRRRREYEAKNNGRESKEKDDHYRGHDVVDFQPSYKTKGRYDYVPRERSIDDGSHYDPRIDKDVGKSTLKRLDKKPPKSEKKSGLEKMKQLFTGKKKKEKERNMVREETLRSRYTEYRGSREEIEPKNKRIEANELNSFPSYLASS